VRAGDIKEGARGGILAAWNKKSGRACRTLEEPVARWRGSSFRNIPEHSRTFQNIPEHSRTFQMKTLGRVMEMEDNV